MEQIERRGEAGKKRKAERARELIGTRYTSKDGEFEIVAYDGNQRVTVRFIETGYETVVSFYCIQKGTVHDRYHPAIFGIGYIDDKFPIEPKVRQKAYMMWHAMLKRCTDPTNHNYNDVTVDPRWHSFKNFCEDIQQLEGYDRWLTERYIALDKDIKVKGNRVYAKEFCKFVTVGENAIDSVARKMEKRWVDYQAKQQERRKAEPASMLSVQW